MQPILVDTAAVYALLDRSDKHHTQAVQVLQHLAQKRSDLIMTNFIVGECFTLLQAKLGVGVARTWLFNNRWRVERVSLEDEIQTHAILRQFQDKNFSYTDASSFAVMERLGIRSAFTYDHHFAQYGFAMLETAG